ncbi:hypothetical protein [Undibacterium flavidum]|uniref:Uncharacterized protein n=1 Tax=Undibacterium flavidum TaxID=2762297 RepID=A0ABR6Y8K9_9BURK|nr:hypothetical protein [Undibacterium flavidum]MBC3872945.1 hypothetical protein [Undibacterium flavidum]
MSLSFLIWVNILDKNDVAIGAVQFLFCVFLLACEESNVWAQVKPNGNKPASVSVKSKVGAVLGSSNLQLDSTTTLTLDSIRLLAVDTKEQIGVFSVPERGLITVHAEELIPGTQTKLIRIALDKAVLEERRLDAPEKQLAWLYKTQGTLGGRLQRFSKSVVPELYMLPPTMVRGRDPLSSRKEDERPEKKSFVNGVEQQ